MTFTSLQRIVKLLHNGTFVEVLYFFHLKAKAYVEVLGEQQKNG